MAEQLARALQVSGSGFDSKLQAVLGTFQNLQKSQVAKQRMAQQLEQGKQLIDYRTQSQIRAEQEVYETVTKPQAEAEAQQQVYQQLQEGMNEGNELAQKRYDEFYEQYSNVANYNFMDVNFRPEPDLETGQVQNKVYVNGEETTYKNYRDQLEQYSQMANEIDEMIAQGKAGELGSITDAPDDGNYYITSDNANKTQEQLRRDPEFRNYILDLKQEDKLKTFVPEEQQEDTGGGSTAQSPIGSAAVQVMTKLGGQNVKNYGIATDLSWNPFGGDVEAEYTLDIRKPVGVTQKEINEQFFKPLGIDLSKLPSGEIRSQIINGDTTGLSGTEEEYAETFSSLLDTEQGTDVQELLWFYDNLPKVYNQYAKETANRGGVRVPMDQAIFNPSYEGGIESAFINVNERQNTASAIQGWGERMRQ